MTPMKSLFSKFICAYLCIGLLLTSYTSYAGNSYCPAKAQKMLKHIAPPGANLKFYRHLEPYGDRSCAERRDCSLYRFQDDVAYCRAILVFLHYYIEAPGVKSPKGLNGQQIICECYDKQTLFVRELTNEGKDWAKFNIEIAVLKKIMRFASPIVKNAVGKIILKIKK